MARSLAMVAFATAFLLCLVAIKGHSELVRTGYEVTELTQEREALQMEAARSREQVSQLGSPAALSRLADDLGLSMGYPKEFGVVRVAPSRIEGPVMALKD